MTEERARHYAKALARSMGITFYVVRSREGRFLAVQIPSDDCEILATVARHAACTTSGNSAANMPGVLLNGASAAPGARRNLRDYLIPAPL